MHTYYSQTGGCFDGFGKVCMYNINTCKLYYKNVNNIRKTRTRYFKNVIQKFKFNEDTRSFRKKTKNKSKKQYNSYNKSKLYQHYTKRKSNKSIDSIKNSTRRKK